MEPDHTARDAAMARLETFIGEWVMEAGFPGGSGGTGRAVRSRCLAAPWPAVPPKTHTTIRRLALR